MNVCAIDFSQAFDRVDHFALLLSLKFYWCAFRLVIAKFCACDGVVFFLSGVVSLQALGRQVFYHVFYLLSIWIH